MKQFVVFAVLFIGIVFSRPQNNGEQPNNDAENKLKFYYFPTAQNKVEIIYNDTESLLAANLKPATKTMFLIDGFTSPGFTPMNLETKDVFTGRPDINVIIVDWSAYSGHGRPIETIEDGLRVYLDVLFNELPKAGSNLADFIHFMCENTQVGYRDVTLIGLSMGCHTSGAAGKSLISKYNKTIGRIVGEDPALQFSALDAPIRLRSGDAEVVEIYNTNRKQLGDIYHAVGDVAIFVNGGENQPCENEYCHSHVYSYKLYNYLASNETIKACPCKGAACLCEGCDFECGVDGISIGPNIPENARGTYHVKTGYLDWGSP